MNQLLQHGPARVFAFASLLGAFGSLAGCAGRLHQVPASAPHGVIELRFEQVRPDLLYDHAVRIDDGEEQTVKSGDQVRLRPGTHRLELASTSHSYGLGTVPVTRPGPCIDPLCTRILSVTEPQQAVVETGRTRCAQRLDVSVEADSVTVARLHVAADQTCAAQHVPGTGP